MAKNGLIAALDIGTSKIACFIGQISPSGKISVLGIGHQISDGIKAGIIIDVKRAESSILAAVNSAEKMAGANIEEAFVNISGGTIGSHILDVETTISGHEVTEKDISHVIEQGEQHCKSMGAEILHSIPIAYRIDDTRGIKNPRGMFGEVLSTELHVITASTTAARNISNCLARCHLNVEGFVATPYASSIACLTKDEKNLGVILLDIGAGNTSISVFSKGNIIYADSIALGGSHITRDIAKGLSTSIAYAERIKNLYGSVITTRADKHEMIEVPISDLDEDVFEPPVLGSEDEGNYVSKAILTSIIKPRVEEILEMTKGRIEKGGFYQMSGPRIVLTGGSSQIPGVKELVGHIFGKHVRVGRPADLSGMADSVKGPAFSASIGMLKFAAEKRKEDEESSVGKKFSKKSAMSGIFRWFKEGA